MPAELRSGPLFVVGMWRSGTSLLYSLLNQHPQIGLMYEADLFLLRPLFSRKGSKRDWQGRWEFWNSALSRHNVPTDKIPEAGPDLPAAASAVWREYAGTAAVMGEKSPNYYDCLQTLSEQFPDARFLVIWRDLADICRSILSRPVRALPSSRNREFCTAPSSGITNSSRNATLSRTAAFLCTRSNMRK